MSLSFSSFNPRKLFKSSGSPKPEGEQAAPLEQRETLASLGKSLSAPQALARGPERDALRRRALLRLSKSSGGSKKKIRAQSKKTLIGRSPLHEQASGSFLSLFPPSHEDKRLRRDVLRRSLAPEEVKLLRKMGLIRDNRIALPVAFERTKRRLLRAKEKLHREIDRVPAPYTQAVQRLKEAFEKVRDSKELYMAGAEATLALHEGENILEIYIQDEKERELQRNYQASVMNYLASLQLKFLLEAEENKRTDALKERATEHEKRLGLLALFRGKVEAAELFGRSWRGV